MKALLSNYKQSPRKVGLVADLIRGKSVMQARAALMYLPKKSAPVLAKLLDSAVANARSMNIAPENLFVKTITVNKGMVMRRSRPFARGRAGAVRKTMSIVSLELGSNEKATGTGKTGTRKKAKVKKTKSAEA